MKIPFALFALCSFGLFLAGCGVLIQRLLCPVQVNQGEAINVEFARAFWKGAMYQDPTYGPYFHAAYPPLFPFIQGILLYLLPGPWLPGRLLAFGAYLGCAVFLFSWGWHRWGKAEALAAASLFLLSPTWAAWGSMVRIDTLTVFLEFGAFLLLSYVETSVRKEKDAKRWLLTAGFTAGAALLCKQNAAILVMAYGSSCLIQRKWKRFFCFVVPAFSPAALVFLWLQITSHGFYFKETVSWVSYGYQPELLVYYLKNSFAPECGWLLIGVALAWFSKTPSWLLRSQMVLVTLSLLGLGRKTSSENYFLEFILYGLFFLGEAWGKDSEGTKMGFSNIPAKAAWGAFLLAGFIFFNLRVWPGLPAPEEIFMKQKAAEIYALPGEHLALDPDLPLMAGKRIWIQPVEYTALVAKGHWSLQPLLRNIQSKKFTTIELYDIPDQYLLPNAVVAEVDRSYQVRWKVFGRRWYVPR